MRATGLRQAIGPLQDQQSTECASRTPGEIETSPPVPISSLSIVRASTSQATKPVKAPGWKNTTEMPVPFPCSPTPAISTGSKTSGLSDQTSVPILTHKIADDVGAPETRSLLPESLRCVQDQPPTVSNSTSKPPHLRKLALAKKASTLQPHQSSSL